MLMLLGMLALTQTRFDETTICVTPNYEIRFNQQDKEKMLALPIWVDVRGRWRDDRSTIFSSEIERASIAVSDKQITRVNLIFQERSVVVLAVQLYKAMCLSDKTKPTIIYVDVPLDE